MVRGEGDVDGNWGWVHVHWRTGKRSKEVECVWMRESDLKEARRRRNRRSRRSEAKRQEWAAGQVVMPPAPAGAAALAGTAPGIIAAAIVENLMR